MANDLLSQLIEQIRAARDIEASVSHILDSMSIGSVDREIARELEHQRADALRHERLLAERLAAHGEGPSTNRYVVVHYKIALYELLERFAVRAGDPATAELARRSRADEDAMAQSIASNWDRYVALTVEGRA